MADTLTQLIAKVQAQLLDDGTLFTTATVTAAARLALNDLNKAASLTATALITAIAEQKEYELSDEDPLATQIIDVLLDGDNEYDVGLAYDAYVEDARWFFRLRTPQAAGETLIVHYAKPHTVSGLDASLDSTLDDALNVALLNGTCYYACLARAAYGVQANNVEQGVPSNWLELASHWAEIFRASLRAAQQQPTVKGEPSRLAWNDDQHNALYP